MKNTINEDKKWKVLSSEYLVKRPWLTARKDVIDPPVGQFGHIFPGGQPGPLDQVLAAEHLPFLFFVDGVFHNPRRVAAFAAQSYCLFTAPPNLFRRVFEKECKILRI